MKAIKPILLACGCAAAVPSLIAQETDPVYTASPSAGITQTEIDEWNSGDATQLVDSNGDTVAAVDSNGDFAIGEDTTVTAPAVKADFKVESNGVIWAGEGAGFDATNQVPSGVGDRMIWIPSKSALSLGNHGGFYGFDDIGSYSTVFGRNNAARKGYSTAWGLYNYSDGTGSTAWGTLNTIRGHYSTGWGDSNLVEGGHTTAWGTYNTVRGNSVTVWGYYNVAESKLSTVFGQFNIGGYTFSDDGITYNDGDTVWFANDPLLEIGNGTQTNNRGNALTLLKDGRIALGSHTSMTALQTNEETVQIQGPVLLGDYADILTATPAAGAIRYDATANDFEGYNGTEWKSLTKGASVVSSTGIGSVTWGSSNAVSGGGSTAWGESNIVSGGGSTAWGGGNSISTGSTYATAWGTSNEVSGSRSTAWGNNNLASDNNATAWGDSNTASDNNATAWGLYNTASGEFSTVWGSSNTASEESSTAWGEANTASGTMATAWGRWTLAESRLSTALGQYNIGGFDVGGNGSSMWVEIDPLLEIGHGDSTTRANALTVLKNGRIALGSHSSMTALQTNEETVQIQGPVLLGDYADILTATPAAGAIRYDATANDFEGYNGTEWKSLTKGASIVPSTGTDSVTWGDGNTAEGDLATAWGSANTASAWGATAWGGSNNATGPESTAWGDSNTASAWGSTAWGEANTASGYESTAWGNGNRATAHLSTVWGSNNVASSYETTAWGQSTRASGGLSTAWGEESTASGSSATSWGVFSTASGTGSTVWGDRTVAEARFSTTFGAYNLGGFDSTNNGNSVWVETDPLLEVGNGIPVYPNELRSNAITVLKDGRIALGSHSSMTALQTNEETVQIQGPVLLGDYADILTATVAAGAIRYDATANDFEGYDGTEWKSLTMVDSTTETDPVFTASPAGAIVEADVTNWNEAHTWGDHTTAGYLTTEADSDPANEVNTSFLLNGTTLEITDSAGTLSQDLSGLIGGDLTVDSLQVGTSAVIDATTVDNLAELSDILNVGSEDWIANITGPDVTITALDIDSNNNRYVAGYFQETVAIGPYTLTSAGNDDIFVARVDADGAVIWAKSYGGTSADDAMALSVNSSDAVYISGVAKSYDYDLPLAGGGTVPLARSPYFMQLDENTGEVNWVQSFGNTYTKVNDISTVGGVVTIAGSFSSSSVTMDSVGGGTITLSRVGTADGYAARFNESGEAVWAKSFAGSGQDELEALAVDSAGSVFIVGDFYSPSLSMDASGGGTLTLTQSGNAEVFAAKLHGTTGDAIWAEFMNSTGTKFSRDMAIDSSGNPVIAIASSGATYSIPGVGGTTISFSTSNKTVIVKYDGNTGEATWARVLGASSTNFPENLSVDASENIVVAGQFNGPTYVLDDTAGGTITLTNAAGADYNAFVTLIEGNSGDAFWAHSFGDTGTDKGLLATIGTDGSVSLVATIDSGTAAMGSQEGIGNALYTFDPSWLNNYVPGDQRLDVDGGVVLGNLATDTTGAIRWTGTDFEGYNGTDWKSLTTVDSVVETDPVFTASLAKNINQDDLDAWNEAHSWGNHTTAGYLTTEADSDPTNEVNTSLVLNGTTLEITDSAGTLSQDLGSLISSDLAVDSLQIGATTIIDAETANNLAGFSDLLTLPDASVQDSITSFTGVDVSIVGMGVDSSNNRYITGSFQGRLTLGDRALTSRGQEDVFVIKLSSGGVIDWAESFGGDSTDVVEALSVSSNGTLAIAGHFTSDDFSIVEGQALPRFGASEDAFVARLDGSDGSTVWAKSFGGTHSDKATAVSIDDNGQVTVAGEFKSNSFQIGTDTFANATNIGDIYVTRLAGNNGDPIWAKSYASDDYDVVEGIAVSSAGDVFITGYYKGTSIDFDSITLTSAGEVDFFVARLDGSNGGTDWAESFGSSSYEYSYALALDNSEDVLIGGRFASQNLAIGSTTLLRTGSYDAFVALINGTTGTPMWAQSFTGNGDDRVKALSLTNTGEIVVGGYYSNEPLEIMSSEQLPNTGSDDIFIAGLDGGTGTPVWASSFGGSLGDELVSLVVAPDNTISLAANLGTTVDFGSRTGFGASLYTFDSNWLQTYEPEEPGQTAFSVHGGSANGANAIAFGNGNVAEGDDSFVFGANNVASGIISTAWGEFTTASGWGASSWGTGSIADGYMTTAWGDHSHAIGSAATTWGEASTATGDYSTAWGSNTTASGYRSTAWGQHSAANGENSTAWGASNANGKFATSWGAESIATGDYSTVWGASSTVDGKYGTAAGYVLRADAYNNTVFGRLNLGGGTADSWVSSDPLFEVGNTAFGYDWEEQGEFVKSNAFTILKDGRIALGTHTSLPGEAPETVQVNGAILVGDYDADVTTVQATAGAIRYDTTANDFKGYNGTEWKSLIADLPDTANWDAAYGWGDHASVGYLTTEGDSDPTNEVNTALALNGTILEITDSAGTLSQDLSSLIGGDLTVDSLQVGDSAVIDAKTADNLASLGSLFSFSDTSAQDWIMNFSGNSFSIADLALDTDGNRYIAGSFESILVVGTETLVSNGGTDSFVAKLDATGSLLWAYSFGGNGSDTVYALDVCVTDSATEVDAEEPVTVTVSGSFDSTDLSLNGETLPSSGGSDVFVMKMNSDGDPLWVKSFGGSGFDRPATLAVSGGGEVVLAGSFSGSDFSIVSGETVANAGANDVFLTKMSADGDPLWAKSFGGSSQDYATSLALGSSDEIVLVGMFSGSNLSIVNGETLSNSGLQDVYVAKLDANGDPLWATSFGDSQSEQPEAVVIDGGGAITVAGFFRSPTMSIVSGETLVNAGNNDAFLVHYNNSNGDPLWATSFGGSGNDRISSLALDSANRVIAVGAFFDSGPSILGGDVLSSVGGSDAFVARFDITNNGSADWAISLGDDSYEGSELVSIAADESITLVGASDEGSFFGSRLGLGRFLYSFDPTWLMAYESPEVPNDTALSVHGSEALGANSIALGAGNFAEGNASAAFGTANVAKGNNALVWGSQNIASGGFSTLWGEGNTANGEYSTVWGNTNVGFGELSTAWGTDNFAHGDYSTVWGEYNIANGYNSTAWGEGNTADGYTSTTWGSDNTANGEITTAWGASNLASGTYSTAWGEYTKAEAYLSTALGAYNLGGYDVENDGNEDWIELDPLFEIGNGTDDASRSNAVTVLKNGQTTLQNKHWLAAVDNGEDPSTILTDPNASEGLALVVQGHTKIEGQLMLQDGTVINDAADLAGNGIATELVDSQGNSIVSVDESGDLTLRTGGEDNMKIASDGSVTIANEFTVGQDTSVIAPILKTHLKVEDNGVIWAGEGADFDATNLIPTGEGTRMVWIPGKNAFRAGYAEDVNGMMTWDFSNIGDYSAAWGKGSTASAHYSTAWGHQSTASNYNATAWGNTSTANNYNSTAWGYYTTASGNASTAWGNNTEANGDRSTAWGYYTEANGFMSTAMGRYNIGEGDPTTWIESDPLFEIGNGTNVNRTNVVTILKDGRVAFGTHSSLTDLQTRKEALQVQGTVLVGDYDYVAASATPTAGAIRYDVADSDFQGYNGTEWKSLITPDLVSETDVTNWNAAYLWGNHADAGYLTSIGGDLSLAGGKIGGLANGSDTEPTLSFDGDPDTGIYSPAADSIAVATAGAERLAIAADGTVTVSGPLVVQGDLTLEGALVRRGDVYMGQFARPASGDDTPPMP